MTPLPLPHIHPRPLLHWVAASTLGLGFVTAVLFVSGARLEEDGTNYYIPEGYRNTVSEMAEARAIRHEKSLPGDTRQVLPPWGRLVFDDSSANPRQEKFHEESRRLRADLAEFNETGSGFFEVQLDGGIRIARHYHNFALPYPERPVWRGSISLGGEKLPALVGEGLYLGFSSTGEDGVKNAGDIKRLNLDEWTRPAPGQSHKRAMAYELKDSDVTLARLRLEGRLVMLELADTQHGQIKLNGDVINNPNSAALRRFLSRNADLERPSAAKNTAPLREGDRLRILHKRSGREVALRYGSYAGGMVSRRWLEDGREVNLVDPELAAELPYFQQLQDALNRFVQEHPQPDQVGQPNIRMSIDSGLHSGVNRVFLDAVRGFDSNRSPVRDIQMQPAAVCVINALNGDVLAMPSYPAPEDIASLRRRAQSGALAGVTEAKLRRLGMNQNLTLAPIGSTTKPLLASAIWETRPELSRLIIKEPKGGRSSLLGYMLAGSYGTFGERTVDSKGFLCMSSNDYTIHLGLLILAREVKISPAGDPVFPDGRADLSAWIQGDEIPGGLARGDLPPFAKLAECYDVGLVEDMNGGPSERWEAGVLAPMLRQIGLDEELLRPLPPHATEEEEKQDPRTRLQAHLYNSLSSVMPERANLALNTVSTVRGKYTSLLLGSGTNYWSNLKLAEAYARLGTGRKVQARLILDPEKQARLEEFPAMPLADETLAKVHAGMQQCAEGLNDSTAERISDSIQAARRKYAARGLQFFALAKTGTATRRGPLKKGDIILEDKRECSAFCLYVEVRDKNGTPLAALSTSTYLQDRAATKKNTAPKNSAVAVQLTEDFFPELLKWLDEQPAVKKAASAK